jgi:hypothetical protein
VILALIVSPGPGEAGLVPHELPTKAVVIFGSLTSVELWLAWVLSQISVGSGGGVAAPPLPPPHMTPRAHQITASTTNLTISGAAAGNKAKRKTIDSDFCGEIKNALEQISNRTSVFLHIETCLGDFFIIFLDKRAEYILKRKWLRCRYL